jgi:hypothetical protein
MEIDKRLIFVRKWFQRASQADDPFDRFFSLWIALVVASQRARTNKGSRYIEDDNDRKRILDYFLSNECKVFQALQNHQDILLKLSQRRGTRYRSPILDTGNPVLGEKFLGLAKHYNRSLILSEEELVEAVAELFNKVRNNLFHGVKIYDDREDIALLELVNPILSEILRACEIL